MPMRAWLMTLCLLLNAPLPAVEAAVSKGRDTQLDTASINQGGGVVTSSRFRQQAAIGEAVSGHRISSARFIVRPGFIGAGLSGETTTKPVSDLDLAVIEARTGPLGSLIAPKTWQRAKSPIFIWEPPHSSDIVAGYSYAIDAEPDDLVDTTDASLNVATSTIQALADGQHTFHVQALNSAGHAGKPATFEIWVDVLPPTITGYTPGPGTLLNTAHPTFTISVADAGSGISPAASSFLVSGSALSMTFNQADGVFAATGGAWHEGTNSLELRVADLAGNVQTPLLWSVRVDTQPPTGTLVINGGADLTTSVYVTLGLHASDATSGVARVLLSNEAAAGYVEEPYVALRELWKLATIRGSRTVYAKFVDGAGNVSQPIAATIELGLLSPETVITSGPAGLTPNHAASFGFMCPEGDCVFSYAFDNEEWSAWSAEILATRKDLAFGNHYFRVKAAKDVNSTPGIQSDEEDPAPAERTWIVGVEAPIYSIPKGPMIKVWRLE